MLDEDLAYLATRFVVAALAVLAAGTTLAYVLRIRRQGRPVGVALSGSTILGIAAGMSIHDALDTVRLLPSTPVALNSWMWLSCFDFLLPFWGFLLVRAWRARDRAEAELAELAMTDPLTGVLNRRGLMTRSVVELIRQRRLGGAATVVTFDLDRFKAINDRHGHDAGDRVLCRFAAVLASGLRAGDLLARTGGEEFALLLAGSDAAQAAAIVERLRERVRAEVAHPAGVGGVITASAGIAGVDVAAAPEMALVGALGAADRALYQAKHDGRDRAVLAAPLPDVAVAVACPSMP